MHAWGGGGDAEVHQVPLQYTWSGTWRFSFSIATSLHLKPKFGHSEAPKVRQSGQSRLEPATCHPTDPFKRRQVALDTPSQVPPIRLLFFFFWGRKKVAV